jgi:hypothetical protein
MSYIDLYRNADRVMPLPGGPRRTPRRKPGPAPWPRKAAAVVPAVTALAVVAKPAALGAFLARYKRSAVYRKARAHGHPRLAELGDFGFSFKRFAKGIGRGLKKAGKAGFMYATPVGLAYTAGKAGWRARKKIGRLAGSALKWGSGAGFAIAAAKGAGKLFGGGGGKRAAAPGAEEQAPEEEEQQQPEEEGGGQDEGGGDQDEGGGDQDEGDDQEQAEMEGLGLLDVDRRQLDYLDDGMGWGFLNKIGRGFKTIGKGIGKGALAVGKVGVKVGGQLAKNTLSTYLGPGQQQTQAPDGGQGGGGGPGFNWKSPIVIGGAAVAVVGGVLLLRRKPTAVGG